MVLIERKKRRKNMWRFLFWKKFRHIHELTFIGVYWIDICGGNNKSFLRGNKEIFVEESHIDIPNLSLTNQLGIKEKA
jgi:hypothetical protein